MMPHKNKIQTIVGLIILLIWSGIVSAVPQAELIHFWNKSNEANRATIDHSAWQSLLDRYLDANHPSGVNRFDYAKLKATDKRQLKSYLVSLLKLEQRTYSKAEQKAYWINLYNALTIYIIVKRYPVKSIKKIGWFGIGSWDKKLISIQGQKLSLNDIEHGILRPIWRDNRIHYAVNCASIGCPNLASKAYTAANTESLLEAGANAYVNHPRGVQFKNGFSAEVFHYPPKNFRRENFSAEVFHYPPKKTTNKPYFRRENC